MDKMDGKGMNIVDNNEQIIKRLFPECVVEKKIDFDKLRELLTGMINGGEEKYDFSWNGKNDAIKLALTPSSCTLLPKQELSKQWQSTKNIYVEGDNLDVLKTIAKTYHNSIKMIYIDPPYNTGKDFVYHDDFKKTEEDYLSESGQALKANPETSGTYHTNWLNMIYPRLKIAHELLSDDGIIYISIDDHEVKNLLKICDEIFGESNFVANLIWKSKSGGANDVNNIATDSEFIVAYAKHLDALVMYPDPDAEVTTSYNQVDEDGRRYSLDRLDKQSLGYHESLDFPIIGPDGKTYVVEHKNPNNKVARWRWGKETVEERYDELVFKWPYVYTKNYEKEEGNTARNLLVDERFGRTRTGKTEVAALFNKVAYFDFPKPTKLIKFLEKISTKDDDTILDFFSGSGTTAHATFLMNAEDGGNRKFVLVQIEEPFDEKTKAYQDGYKNICQFAEERIRRAGDDVHQSLVEKKNEAGLLSETVVDPDTFDYGFKVFKLSSTNIIPWDGSEQYDESNLLNLNDVFKEGRTKLDVAYEVMLKYGVFDKQLEEKKINGKDLYCVDNDSLVIFLEDEIDMDDVKEIIKLNPTTVVFKESGFADDNVKMNAEYTLRHYLGEDQIKVLCI